MNRRTHGAHNADTVGSTPTPATIPSENRLELEVYMWMDYGPFGGMKIEMAAHYVDGYELEALSPYLLPNGELYAAVVMLKREVRGG